MRVRGQWLAAAVLVAFLVPASLVLSSTPAYRPVPYATPGPTATPTPYRAWWYDSSNWAWP